jgi:hypothetical protein
MKNFPTSIPAAVLIAAAVLISMGAEPAVAQSTPEQTAKPTAATQLVEAKTTPTPPSASELKPTPNTVDLALLGSSPKEWPKFVTLKQKTDFTAVINGQVVGSVQVPAGIQVSLLALRGEEVRVQYQGASKLISAQSTDLVERVLLARRATGR